ncbi:sensor histidine kinase [Sulfuricurvum sp.]|uniref:sensor histidine kinase n=1 Tax=Sulfuricurvum sp. TaxID=2025608 RepID=UPI003BB1F86F
MKRVESEAFTKSFLLFFFSLGILNTFLFLFEYHQERHDFDENILTQMKVCSFDLKCTQFKIDFAPLDPDNLYKLSKDDTGVYAFFSIPKSESHSMKLTLPIKDYEGLIEHIFNHMLLYYSIVMLFIALLSVFFSLYALYPLKKALELTEEFSKDILHDFNTPLASLRLNVRMLQCPESERKKIQRIEQSIETILSLQKNLRGYLEDHSLQKEVFDVRHKIEERIALMQKIYPTIHFEVHADRLEIATNDDAFTRIIDNLLSNAAKYNQDEGRVNVILDAAAKSLKIMDTGKGITNTKRIFERFYKEQERGIGIGLHIVKKLCDTMEIPISVSSKVGEGTSFTLDLSKLTLR